MIVIEVLIGALAGLLLFPVLVLFLQVLMALLPMRASVAPTGKRPKVAVLVPAHNEAAVIAATLETLLPQLQSGDRLLVVADNCSDDTAALARAAGAEVHERTDHERRGKGYALDFGVRHLEADPPEVLLIVDADCQVEAGAIDRLARLAVTAKRPVQALYLMGSPPGAGLKMRIAEFAWVVKNQVRPLGYQKLGLPCQLMGTGMAFPWEDIQSADLASGHIVEDLKLGLDLCRQGKAPLFCPDAKVTSVFPGNEEGVRDQRTRWEHGHLGVMVNDAPKLLAEAIVKGKGHLLAMTLDLLVPPLALLALLVMAVFSCSLVFFAISGAMVPAGISLAGITLLLSAILMAWAGFGRNVISLTNLAFAPLYAALKVPLYLKFLVSRQVEWVRSKRDPK